MPPRETLFLDTSYFIALAAPKDKHQLTAKNWAAWLKQARSPLLTHEGILTEIGDGFSRPPRRSLGIDLLGRLSRDSQVEIAPIDAQLRHRAFQLYASRLDKDWGLTDCMSFVLMTERGISSALTTDQHFVQAGFRALLDREPPL